MDSRPRYARPRMTGGRVAKNDKVVSVAHGILGATRENDGFATHKGDSFATREGDKNKAEESVSPLG
jgi:hypothetical protein